MSVECVWMNTEVTEERGGPIHGQQISKWGIWRGKNLYQTISAISDSLRPLQGTRLNGFLIKTTAKWNKTSAPLMIVSTTVYNTHDTGWLRHQGVKGNLDTIWNKTLSFTDVAQVSSIMVPYWNSLRTSKRTPPPGPMRNHGRHRGYTNSWTVMGVHSEPRAKLERTIRTGRRAQAGKMLNILCNLGTCGTLTRKHWISIELLSDPEQSECSAQQHQIPDSTVQHSLPASS